MQLSARRSKNLPIVDEPTQIVDEPTPSEHAAQRPVAAANSVTRQAARICLIATMLQIPVGLWVLFELPAAVQSQILGESMLATGLFGLSVVSALGLMHYLSRIALGDAGAGVPCRATALLIATVLLMASALQSAQRPVYHQMRDREGRQPHVASHHAH